MDAQTVEAMVLFKSGERLDTPGAMSKKAFAGWLLDVLLPPGEISSESKCHSVEAAI